MKTLRGSAEMKTLRGSAEMNALRGSAGMKTSAWMRKSEKPATATPRS
jgi:hypothetical protein